MVPVAESPQPWTRRTSLGLALIAAIFAALTLPQISVPPLNAEEVGENLFMDEALFASSEQLQLTGGPMVPGVFVLDRYLPLMEDNEYVGAVEMYLQLPFIWLLGAHPLSLRLMPVLFSLAGLLAMFVVLRRAFGGPVAWVCGLLTCTHPVFVHFSRQGHYKEEIFTVGFLWLGLAALQRYDLARRRGVVALVLGALCFGLGLAHKITFIWYLAGLAAAVIGVSVIARQRPALPRVSHLIAASAAFVCGTLPLLAYNALNGWPTVRLMALRLVEPTPKDHIDNLHWIGNFVVRVRQFGAVIVGGEIWDTEWFQVLGDTRTVLNLPLIVLFAVGLVALPWWSWRRGEPRERRAWLGVYLLFGVVLALSPFTVSFHHPSHLLVMVPFPQLIVAGAAVAAVRWAGGRRVVAIVCAAVVAAALTVNVALTVRYHVLARWATPSPMAPLESDRDVLRGSRPPVLEQMPTERW
jgi:4-amino-4-deoxy-L-arabinose transferase-like glycosyltransferase